MRIPIPPDTDVSPSNSDSLRAQRESLGLTQQQVADGAGILLRQYQRFEFGERDITKAYASTFLAVCAVLQLPPFSFLPNAEKYKNYADSISKERGQAEMNRSDILSVARSAFDSFNSFMGTSYSLDNIKIEFFNSNNAAQTYTSFTTSNGFSYEDPSHRDFSMTVAEAFVGNTDCNDSTHFDGILVSTELPTGYENVVSYNEAFIHELAHIFCTTHEIPSAQKAGQRFYDLHCDDNSSTSDDTILNGQINAGYAIWREVIADIITDKIVSKRALLIEDIIEDAMRFANYVTITNNDSKFALQRYLSLILTAREIKNARSRISVSRTLDQLRLPFKQIILTVYDKLNNEPFYSIDFEFINALGAQYIAARIQNTKPDELAAFARSHGLKL